MGRSPSHDKIGIHVTGLMLRMSGSELMAHRNLNLGKKSQDYVYVTIYWKSTWQKFFFVSNNESEQIGQ